MKKFKKVLFLSGNRNGYSIEQCGKTLTVGELIRFLEDFEQECQVFLRNDGGYTYGSIRERDFEQDVVMEETYLDDDTEFSEVEGHSELIKMTPAQACDLHGTKPEGLFDYYGAHYEDIEFVFHGVDEETVGVQLKNGNFCVNNGVVKLNVDYETMLELLEMTKGQFNKHMDK